MYVQQTIETFDKYILFKKTEIDGLRYLKDNRYSYHNRIIPHKLTLFSVPLLPIEIKRTVII